jgi:DNA-binding CsgD family transcriptional regulator
LLAAQVEIALAVGVVGLADAAAGEITQSAAEFESDGLCARSNRWRGAVSLAQGEPVTALGSRLAFAAWQELDVPTRWRAPGPCSPWRTRCSATTTTPPTKSPRRDGLLPTWAPIQTCARSAPSTRRPGGLTPRDVAVLRLVAGGQSNREVAAALVGDRTVARHVANVYAKLGISSRSAATSFAHERTLV